MAPAPEWTLTPGIGQNVNWRFADQRKDSRQSDRACMAESAMVNRRGPGMDRRALLKGTGAVAGATVANAVAQVPEAAPQPSRKLKIVVTGGHPGDPEYGCGGTVARLTAAGHEAVLLYLNDGGWETAAAVRMAEAKKACDILKARAAYAGQA